MSDTPVGWTPPVIKTVTGSRVATQADVDEGEVAKKALRSLLATLRSALTTLGPLLNG